MSGAVQLCDIPMDLKLTFQLEWLWTCSKMFFETEKCT